MPGRVDIILMASGFSRRFAGGNKLLLHFRGKSLARRALELACSPAVAGETRGEAIFVCAAEEVAAEAAGLPARVVRNSGPERGMRESVRLGVEASNAEYCLFMPCDQPLLDAETVLAVLARRRPEGAGSIVVPRSPETGEPGNPVLFSAAFREELLSLRDGETPRILKARHAGCVEYAEPGNPEALLDIDDEEDLKNILLC